MKYGDYVELAAAFKSGELGKGYLLVLDKGGTENTLTFYDPDLSEEENGRRQDECAELFNPDFGVEPMLEALGIPFEWA
jgi:hypothetical protein